MRETTTNRAENCWMRWSLLAFGWANVGLGVIGIFVPGLPTTVFLLIAFWAFSKSSERFQNWLWTHPKLGPPIRDWHDHRVIPLKAKVLAAVMMASSFVYVAVFVAETWLLPALMAAVMVPAAAYVLTRSSAPPQAAEAVGAEEI
ncbi:MAG: YbaN family protein [Magnetovibrio sp.]|nr:YbaN family protein [Magnetovibrio sp.]